jgi:hypothetical protein
MAHYTPKLVTIASHVTVLQYAAKGKRLFHAYHPTLVIEKTTVRTSSKIIV